MSTPTPTPPGRCDLAVVGGGILGLALARELIGRNPGASICVLEKEAELARHQSARNSGVIHAGIYYSPGSLKAKLCVLGAAQMYSYCEERRIPFERCGKLIVALEESELAGLDELERRGRANGVADLRRLDPAELREIEPRVAGLAALHSPNTGIVDFQRVARSFAADFTAAGGRLATGCEVSSLQPGRGSVRLRHGGGTLEAGAAVCCAGLWSDRLAIASGADPDPRIVPFRGAYLRLLPDRRRLIGSLIYPVPDPSLPFLGVHLTRRIDGEVLIGPTALLAASGLARTLAWPGSWRMISRWWRSGLTEIRHAAWRRALVSEAARYVPGIAPAEVRFAFAGLRAQAIGRDGSLVDDFVFSRTGRTLHLRNAPSPGATSSLAIAARVADEAEAHLL